MKEEESVPLLPPPSPAQYHPASNYQDTRLIMSTSLSSSMSTRLTQHHDHLRRGQIATPGRFKWPNVSQLGAITDGSYGKERGTPSYKGSISPSLSSLSNITIKVSNIISHVINWIHHLHLMKNLVSMGKSVWTNRKPGAPFAPCGKTSPSQWRRHHRRWPSSPSSPLSPSTSPSSPDSPSSSP